MSMIIRTGLAVTNKLGLWDLYARISDLVHKSRARVIMYHRVAEPKEHPWSLTSVSPHDFEDQIKYARLKYNIIAINELASYVLRKQSLPRRAMVITFDDGYRDNYLHAYPVLKKYNVPATIFLTTGNIGSGDLFWIDQIGYVVYHSLHRTVQLDSVGSYSLGTINERFAAMSSIIEKAKKLSSEERDLLINKLINVSAVDIPADLGKELILSWDEVREMSNNGITFGAHTVTHPVLARTSLEQTRYEITQAKREIEDRLDKTVTAFAYPFGKSSDFSTDTVELLRENGFNYAVTTIKGMVTPDNSLLELPRISPGWDLCSFKFLTCGLYYHLLAMRGTKSKVG